ncbi:MAG: hypothetical protein GEV03_00220 [Streptosporangiales bacterium]|nr:hypothetical protein [Streptosporangiales bacterium]
MPDRDLSSELAAVADELYRLPPDEFVIARDKRALEFRDLRDRRLADAVHQLHRPSQAAWLVNLLARERARELDELLRLGGDLRVAQEQLRGEELRELSTRRQRVVAALVGSARRLAHEAGHPVRDRVAQEVETTLHAALADSQVASVVRAGRLTSTRRYAGFGTQPTPADDDAGRAAAGEGTTARPKRRRIREWEWLAAGVREAEEALRDAEAELVEREGELTRADEEQNSLNTRVVELTEQLERAESKATEAGQRRRGAQEARDGAATRAEDARRNLEAARARLAAAGAGE